MSNTIVSIKESILNVKTSLKNAKARHKAAAKAYDKAFDSEDELKQVMYEDKMVNEQETIDDLNRELEELEAKIEELTDVDSLDEEYEVSLMESQEEAQEFIEEAKKVSTKNNKVPKEEEVKEIKEETSSDKDTMFDTIRTSYNTKSGDWPQHSYRVPPEKYEPLKKHIKEESMFNNLADMSRSLCMGDYECSVMSLYVNHTVHLITRFIDIYDANSEELSLHKSEILNKEFNKMNATTKDKREGLIKDLKSIRKFIQDKELHRFQVKEEVSSEEE